jgi:predicted aspartyl protease
MVFLGRFDSTGSAVIEIEIAGATGGKSYIAAIDTGFSGFVALPYLEMIDLGLVIEGATNVQLGDGSIITNDIAPGRVTLGTIVATGTVIVRRQIM